MLLFAGSNLPTPLFPIYEDRYGFGSGVVTLLFGAYVVVLVPTLLLLGPVADRIGRRPLLVAGIAVTAVSSMAFAAAQGLAWLFAGEVIYGIGSGLVMSCVAVAIRELHPRQHVASAALAASVAAAAGLTLGPLAGGLLAWATPWPTVAPYAVDIALALLLAAALLRIPETRPPRVVAARRPPLFHVPADIRVTFMAAAIGGASSFMVVGWVFGLSPSYLHEQLGIHITQPAVAGLFAALVMFTNGLSQLALRRHHSAATMRLALVGVLAGMGLMASSSLVGSLAVAIVGAVVAGVGSGVAQMNAMATIQAVVPLHARGGVTSTYFTLCYMALSVPVLIAGAAADSVGLGVVTGWYVVGLAVLIGWALVLGRRAVEVPAHRIGAASPGADLIELPVEPEPGDMPATA